jgi:hypothetical protein
MGWRSFLLLTAAAAVAAGGCGSSGGATGGKDGGGPSDGGVGAADGPTQDGGGPSGSTGCAAYPGALFCDDFETAGTFATNWPTTTGVAPVVATSPTAYSPTHVASAIGDASDHSVMQHILPALLPNQTVRVAFSFRLVEDPGDFALVSNVALSANDDVGLQVSTSVEQGQLTVELLNDASQFPSADAGPESLSLMALAKGEWVRVELDFDLSDPGGVKVLVNGAMAANMPYVPGQMVTGTYQGDLQLEAGESIQVDFDDVVIWQP